MPLYEFVCTNCREKFENLCRSEVDSLSCPSCGAKAKRVFSTFRSTRSSSGGSPASSGSCGG